MGKKNKKDAPASASAPVSNAISPNLRPSLAIASSFTFLTQKLAARDDGAASAPSPQAASPQAASSARVAVIQPRSALPSIGAGAASKGASPREPHPRPPVQRFSFSPAALTPPGSASSSASSSPSRSPSQPSTPLTSARSVQKQPSPLLFSRAAAPVGSPQASPLLQSSPAPRPRFTPAFDALPAAASGGLDASSLKVGHLFDQTMNRRVLAPLDLADTSPSCPKTSPR